MPMARFRGVDALTWAIIGAVGAFVLTAAAAGGFAIVLPSFAAPGATCLALVGASHFYGRYRQDPKLASVLQATAQIAAFAAVGAPLSYIVAAWGHSIPLQDAALDAIDKTIGFDWIHLFDMTAREPRLHAIMHVIYLSVSVQTTTLILLLGFTGRLAWLRVYTLAFFIAALVTIAISGILPAEGVFLHDGLDATHTALVPVSHTSWPVFLGLRDGTYRSLVATGAEGIITFPSLHAALAVIFIAALWPLRTARWICACINIVMLMATPVDGSHYLVDVIAGIGIAIVSLVAAQFAVRRMTKAAITPPMLEPSTVPT
jgi:hypothetical protein